MCTLFYKDFQTKIEFVIENSLIIEIKYKKVSGYEMIPIEKVKDLKKLIENYKYEIVQLWIKFFILHESNITCIKIIKKTIIL